MTKKGGRAFEAHTQTTDKATGDFYGTGVKQKLATVRQWSLGHISNPPKGTSTPPKKIA